MNFAEDYSCLIVTKTFKFNILIMHSLAALT